MVKELIPPAVTFWRLGHCPRATMVLVSQLSVLCVLYVPLRLVKTSESEAGKEESHSLF